MPATEQLTKEVDSLRAIEKDLRDQLRSAQIDRGNLNNEIANLNNQIQIMQAQKVQLEGTIEAAQSQRDRLIDAEADAIANNYIMIAGKDHEIAALNQMIVKLKEEFGPDQNKMLAMERDLQEVRHKFGEAHHVKIRTQKELDAALVEVNNVKTTLEWYANASSGIKSNIPKKFETITGDALSADVVVAAYNESHFYDANKTTLVDFLIEAHGKWKEAQAKAEQQALIDEVESAGEAIG